MESLQWKSHPARERPLATLFVVIFILIIFYFVYDISDNFLMVVMAFFIFLLALTTFFFPTTYTVDERKVTIKYLFTLKERNISAFRSVYPGQRGILLSPFMVPTRLENFRGFYLRYGKDNKEEIDKILVELIDWQNRMMAERKSEGEEDAS
jgi:energy-coupling factor transporter transmembrane protein EcfT